MTDSSDEGASCLEDPPETPAHIFVLRAFKTAIFGTPHPERDEAVHKPPPAATKGQSAEGQTAGQFKESLPKSDSAKADKTDVKKLQLEPSGSPAKGILLTPGAGTTRRKNVSFMQFSTEALDSQKDPIVEEQIRVQDDSPTRPSHKRDNRPRPSSFTKTLLELSKKRADEHLESKKPMTEDRSASTTPEAVRAPEMLITADSDYTVDLSEPRSRSGQHWKTEYEQYYRRSDREMKKMIKYGQNVKSYAVKKDGEASALAEELRSQLAKVRGMEARSAKMARKLSIAESQDSKSEGDHARLVSELAQQTATAAKYKQRLDQYRKTLQQQSTAVADDAEWNESQINPNIEEDSPNQLLENPLQSRIETLKQAARDAETKAKRLESENLELKRSLARVKERMMTYETKRQTKEGRLKKRQEKYKIGKETAEAQLAQLRIDFQQLQQGKEWQKSDITQVSSAHSKAGEASKSPTAPASHPRAPKGNHKPRTYTSPRKRRQQNLTFDIWTQGEDHAPDERQDVTQPSAPPTIDINADIQKGLQEIDLNLIPDAQSVMEILDSVSPPSNRPVKELEPVGFEDGLPVYTATSTPAIKARSSRHEPVDDVAASSPAKLQAQASSSPGSRRSHHSSVGRSASMASNAGARRTSTMSSTMSTSMMTAERKAAARERLRLRSSGKQQ